MENNFLLNMTQSYEFDDSKLNEQDKASVKILAKAEGASYGSAPIGRDIFSFINSIENLKIKNEKLDDLNYLYLILVLSSRYCIPFDLCDFRIQDERLYNTKITSSFFKENESIINNYLKEKDPFKDLLNNENNYIVNDNIKILQKLFLDGNITESHFFEMGTDVDLSEDFLKNIISQKKFKKMMKNLK